MMIVEDCVNWHELIEGHGLHCYNCMRRSGYPQRGQPQKGYCKNYRDKLEDRQAKQKAERKARGRTEWNEVV